MAAPFAGTIPFERRIGAFASPFEWISDRDFRRGQTFRRP
jgi:hypothetical protein